MIYKKNLIHQSLRSCVKHTVVFFLSSMAPVLQCIVLHQCEFIKCATFLLQTDNNQSRVNSKVRLIKKKDNTIKTTIFAIYK